MLILLIVIFALAVALFFIGGVFAVFECFIGSAIAVAIGCTIIHTKMKD